MNHDTSGGTAFLALVNNLPEAVEAAAAGVDRVAVAFDHAVAQAAGGPLAVPLVLLVVDPASATSVGAAAATLGAAEVRAPLALCNDLRSVLPPEVALFGVVPLGPVQPEALVAQAKALDLAGLMLATTPGSPVRLIGSVGLPTLAGLAARCREHGLRLALSGGLEPPDVPRLLPLAPAELGFDAALRRDGSLSMERIREIRDLLDQPSAPVARSSEPDRIFVRDWVLEIGIGAYAHEHDAPQRVRFSVEAEIDRHSGPVEGMRDVVSYDLITDAIQRLVVEHVDLVETLAERIAAAVLEHRRVRAVTVTVEKLDLGPGAVGCRITRER